MHQQTSINKFHFVSKHIQKLFSHSTTPTSQSQSREGNYSTTTPTSTTTTIMDDINLRANENAILISHLYNNPELVQILPQQGGVGGKKVSKRRRRRSKGKDSAEGSGLLKKRKLSSEQVKLLEMNFGNEHKLESDRKDRLASELGLDPRQVAVWFQNRRARWKNKKLEDEYFTLKKAHDSLLLHNSHLQSEMIKLKEEIIEAKDELQQLIERCERISSNSPTSSVTMDAVQTSSLGELFFEEYEDVFYCMQENNYGQGLGWVTSNYI